MSKTKSNYVLQSAEKSHCPKCGSEVDLLCEKDFDGPAFYICFNCKVIGHVGKGPVKMVGVKQINHIAREKEIFHGACIENEANYKLIAKLEKEKMAMITRSSNELTKRFRKINKLKEKLAAVIEENNALKAYRVSQSHRIKYLEKGQDIYKDGFIKIAEQRDKLTKFIFDNCWWHGEGLECKNCTKKKECPNFPRRQRRKDGTVCRDCPISGPGKYAPACMLDNICRVPDKIPQYEPEENK